MDTNKEAETILKKLPPAPSGVEAWIRKKVIQKAYLIFDNRENKAVCTRCGRTFPLKRTHGAEHNQTCACPYCKTKAIWKKSHYGRKALTERFRVLLFTHKGKTVYGTLFEVDADFETFGKARISRWISALYRFTETERIYLKHHPGSYFSEERWEEPKEVKLPCPPRGFNWGTWCKYERTEVYTGNLEAVFTKSCLRYHYDQDFFRRYRFGAHSYIRYMDQCLKYQSMELLRKAGFEQLVMDRIRERKMFGLRIRGKTLKEILRLPKRWHGKVREEKMDTEELSLFRGLNEKEKALATRGTLERLAHDSYYKKEIERHMPFFDAVRYVQRQNSHMWMYRDYLNQARLLGWDMMRKNILYPENLEESHDETMRLLEEERERSQTERLERQTAWIERTFPAFTKGALFIRPARTQEELNQESQALTHCVRTYGDKIARGRCMIFFVRRTEEPDKPFYTLELSPDKEIVQCRGDHNCDMTEEVRTFVKTWAKRHNLKHKIGEEREVA